MGLGGVALLVGSLFDLEVLPGVGVLLIILGLLMLVRAFPGEGG